MLIFDLVEGIDVYEYRDMLLFCFFNFFIKDMLVWICFESLVKFLVFLFFIVWDNLVVNRDIDISVLVVVCWVFYLDRYVF